MKWAIPFFPRVFQLTAPSKNAQTPQWAAQISTHGLTLISCLHPIGLPETFHRMQLWLTSNCCKTELLYWSSSSALTKTIADNKEFSKNRKPSFSSAFSYWRCSFRKSRKGRPIKDKCMINYFLHSRKIKETMNKPRPTIGCAETPHLCIIQAAKNWEARVEVCLEPKQSIKFRESTWSRFRLGRTNSKKP